MTDQRNPVELTGKRVVITGATGQVAKPLALALAENNTVTGLARFSDPAARAELEAAGVACIPVDLTKPDLQEVSPDVDYVLNLAVTKIGKWSKDLAANGEATGTLMSHFRNASAFLHCSSTAVYKPNGGEPLAEDDPLGDHHRDVMPTYSISKIAAETMTRFAAREFQLPTTIARLNVPYGDGGGWPLFQMLMIEQGMPIGVGADGSTYNPIHDRDIARHVPALLGLASTEVPTVNWGGNDAVSMREWSTFIAELLGKEVTFEEDPRAIPSAVCDLTRQHQLVGDCEVHWTDGIRSMVENLRTT